MGNSSAKAEAKALKAQAKETRRQAGIYRETGYEEAADMTGQANSYLSQQIAMLGKVGALGVSSKAVDYSAIDSGVDTGSLEGKSIQDLKSDIAKKEASVEEDRKKAAEAVNEDHRDTLIDTEALVMAKTIKGLNQDKKDLANLQKGLDTIGEVSASETANLTMGSTALNLKTLQDNLEKSRNKYVNQIQEDVYSSIMNAEMLDDQSAAASKAAAMAPFTTLLTMGVGAITGFATGGTALTAFAGGMKAGASRLI